MIAPEVVKRLRSWSEAGKDHSKGSQTYCSSVPRSIKLSELWVMELNDVAPRRRRDEVGVLCRPLHKLARDQAGLPPHRGSFASVANCSIFD